MIRKNYRLMMGVMTVLLLQAVSAHSQQVTFAQTSDPAGFVNQSALYAVGTEVTTVNAPMESGAYRFTHWTLNGVRTNDFLGCAINPVRATIYVDTAAVAHYTNSTLDTDTDGVGDWYEWYHFGSLANDGASDTDGDGCTLAEEYRRDYVPLIKDRIVAGGISRRQSALIAVRITAKEYVFTSEPAGLVNQSGLVETGTVVQTQNLQGDNGAYTFGYWTVDGVRQTNSMGRALSQLTFTVTNDVAAVAHYFGKTEDTDTDGLPDWWEWLNFGNLTYDGTSDTDGDGFTLAEEYRRDYEPLIKDRIVAGGISRRQSAQIQVRITAKQYTFTSDPAGLVNQSGLVETGTVVQTQNLQGDNGAYTFGYWTVDGVRQTNFMGRALSQLTFTVTNDVAAVAHYFGKTDDTDVDGLPDWWEWLNYGDLSRDGTSDADGDGYTLAEEYRRDYEPLIKDRLVAGGVSRRQSAQITYVRPSPQLTVASAYGGSVPGPGMQIYDWEVQVTCSVTNSPVPAGLTQYVCIGWTGAGSVPATGTTTNTGPIILRTNSNIIWTWATNYWLDMESDPNGSVDTGDGWCLLGSNVTVTAAPSNHYHFAGWTGDTKGDTNALAMTVTMDQPRQLQASFAIDQHVLQIASEHGEGAPSTGTYTNDYGAVLTNTVSAVEEQGGTQYVCTGWAMTGNEPVGGAGTNMSMTLTNGAALTWLWKTNYWLNTAAAGGGSVNLSDKWVDAGSNVTVTATASNLYCFAGWTGDTNGATIAGVQITVPMDGPRNVTANFMEDNPGIAVEPFLLAFTGLVYSAIDPQTLVVSNSGGAVLNYTVTPSLFWLSVSNANGSLAAGQSTSHVVRVDTRGLAPRAYPGNLIIAAASATNTPQVVPVSLTVTVLPAPTAVAAWGRMNEGQCSVPAGLSNAVAVSVGNRYSLALRGDDTVLGWGANDYDQCNVPAGLSNAMAIATGYDHSLALRADGTVLAWGHSEYGKCNVPAGLSNAVGVAAGGYHCLALRGDGTVVAWGYNAFGQLNVPVGLSNVVSVSAGAHHSLVLCADGTVRAWGFNGDGECTVPVGLSNAVVVSAGDYHSLALRADGTVLAWGRNTDGECNVPAGLSNAVAVSATLARHSLALRADGTVLAWGRNTSDQCSVPAGLSNAVDVSAGYYHSLALGPGVALTVASPYGAPMPGTGTHYVVKGTTRTASITNSPVTLGTTQYVCTGWASMGSVPASGVNTSVTFVATNDSSITWLWGVTNFYFARIVGANGSVSGATNGWYALGSNLTVTATASNYYCFAGWTGDVQGDTNACAMTVTMDRPRQVQANFVGPCQFSTNVGPYAGGNTITITNGNFGTITNVLVGGVRATIQGSGANWVTIRIPATGSEGLKEIVIQTEMGEITLNGAYTVNPAGQIGVWDWSRWEEVAGLPAARSSLAAGMLNGALYVVGGAVMSSDVHTNVYRYDGTTWAEVAGLPAPRYLLTAEVLNGALYAVGGRDGGGGVHTNVYRYDGTTWAEVAGLPAPRYELAVAERNGALYAVGGNNGSGPQTNVYRYNGVNWAEVAGLPAPCYALAGGVLNGALYAVGGYDGSTVKTNMYRYNGTNWTEVAGLPGPRYNLATEILNGALYAVGGYNGSSYRTNVYSYTGTNWMEVAGLPAARGSLAAGVLNGALYAVGGWNGSARTNVYRYPSVAGSGVSPASGSWTGGYQVVISGANLGNGTDITNVTLCGVSVTILPGQSATQVVVTAGATDAAHLGTGDVRVFSTSFGETVKSNAFTYLREPQAPLVFAPASPQVYQTTNALSVSGGSGTGAVSYAVLSGPGLIVDGTNLTVTSGTGTIWVCATKAQDDLYYAASVTASVAAAKADQTISGFVPTNGTVLVETNTTVLSAATASGLPVSYVVLSGPGLITDGTNLSFTGPGLVAIAASQAGNENYNAAPELTNTITVLAVYDLTIQSAYGTATPGPGTYPFVTGTVLTHTVANPDALGTTQYVCTGWALAGNVATNGASAGAGTNVTLTLTNDTTLTWQWATNYWLDTEVGGNGSVDEGDQWVASGGNRTVTATPAFRWRFSAWSGDTNGAMVAGAQITLPMDMPRAVTANFSEEDPAIVVEPSSLAFSGLVYSAIAPQTLVVSNAGGKTLNYTITSDMFWLSAGNANGSLAAGQSASHTVRTGIRGLAPRTYAGRLTIADLAATNSPRTVTVTLQVAPVRSCTVWAWGRNDFGQTNVVADLFDAVGVAGGGSHSLALRADGQVVAWGYDYFGQANVPAGLTNAVAVAAGASHSLALRADGRVAAWGYNYFGQTNVPAGLTNAVAVTAGDGHSLALRADGCVVVWGSNQQTNVPTGLTDVVSIACGSYHSLALRADGSVVGWGLNYDGQTNVPNGLTNAVAVAAGDGHSLALRADGTVAVWGDNGRGQTNVPADLTNVVAIAAGGWDSLALRADGSVAMWGDNSYGQRDVPAGLTHAVGLAGGFFHAMALLPVNGVRVNSERGMPDPPVGTTWVLFNTHQTCQVDSRVTLGTTQYVCAGWAGSGSVPASGTSNTVSFTITNDSSVTWFWRTNVQFACTAGPHGSAAGDPDGWYSLGGTVTVTALPAIYYHLDFWSGDVPASQTNDNPLQLSMDRARLISAWFAPNLATNGTPHWWLAQYGLETNDTGALHEDGDGQPAWMEYVADTDPTNPASYFCIAAISNLPPVTVYFPSSSQRYYTLQRRDNLLAGDWTNVVTQTALPGADGHDSLHDTAVATQQFYRVEVKVSP